MRMTRTPVRWIAVPPVMRAGGGLSLRTLVYPDEIVRRLQRRLCRTALGMLALRTMRVLPAGTELSRSWECHGYALLNRCVDWPRALSRWRLTMCRCEVFLCIAYAACNRWRSYRILGADPACRRGEFECLTMPVRSKLLCRPGSAVLCLTLAWRLSTAVCYRKHCFNVPFSHDKS